MAGPGDVNLLHGGHLIAGAAPSFAADNGSTTAAVSVRSGPDTGYPLAGKEPAGPSSPCSAKGRTESVHRLGRLAQHRCHRRMPDPVRLRRTIRGQHPRALLQRTVRTVRRASRGLPVQLSSRPRGLSGGVECKPYSYRHHPARWSARLLRRGLRSRARRRIHLERAGDRNPWLRR